MPIYAYRCESCGHAKDVLQKMSDPLLTVCPACGEATFKKQLTAAGFQLKGSGWYVTDFRGDGGKAADKIDGAKSSDTSKAPAADGASSTATPAPAAAPAAAPAPAASPASSGSSGSGSGGTPSGSQ